MCTCNEWTKHIFPWHCLANVICYKNKITCPSRCLLMFAISKIFLPSSTISKTYMALNWGPLPTTGPPCTISPVRKQPACCTVWCTCMPRDTTLQRCLGIRPTTRPAMSWMQVSPTCQSWKFLGTFSILGRTTWTAYRLYLFSTSGTQSNPNCHVAGGLICECEWYPSLTAHQHQKGHTVPKQV